MYLSTIFYLVLVSVSAEAINRQEVITRAERWVEQRVPYSMKHYYEGYRTDCSGYVSMAWNLETNKTTRSLPGITYEIPKNDLLEGDMLLRVGSPGHAVLFGSWVDSTQNNYNGYEQTRSVNRTVKRVIPYPYFRDADAYTPRRFTGISS